MNLKLAIPSCNYHKNFISPLNHELILRMRETCKENNIPYSDVDHDKLKPLVMENKIDFNILVSVGFAGLDVDMIPIYKRNKVKILIIMDDIHKKRNPKKKSQFDRKKYYFNSANLLFLMYPNHFKSMSIFKNIHHKCIPLYWFCPEKVLVLGPEWSKRTQKATLTGITDSKIYTLRHQMFSYYLKHINNIVDVLLHPTYKKPDRNRHKFGFDYYNYLSSYQASIVTSANPPLNYLIAKYFEVLGCGCLGFFEHLKELDELGFIAGQHYLPFKKDNFTKVIQLNNFNPQIAINGRNFVKANHTDRIRARQFVAKVKEIYG